MKAIIVTSCLGLFFDCSRFSLIHSIPVGNIDIDSSIIVAVLLLVSRDL